MRLSKEFWTDESSNSHVQVMVIQRVLFLYLHAYMDHWSHEQCCQYLPFSYDSIEIGSLPMEQVCTSSVQFIPCAWKDYQGGITEIGGIDVSVNNHDFLQKHPWFVSFHPTHCFQHFLNSFVCFETSNETVRFLQKISSKHEFVRQRCAHCDALQSYWTLLMPSLPFVSSKYPKKIWSSLWISPPPVIQHVPHISSLHFPSMNDFHLLLQRLTESGPWNRQKQDLLTSWSQVTVDEDFLPQCQQLLFQCVPFCMLPMELLRKGLYDWKSCWISLYRFPTTWSEFPFVLYLLFFQILFLSYRSPLKQSILSSLPSSSYWRWASLYHYHQCRQHGWDQEMINSSTVSFISITSKNENDDVFWKTHPSLRQ